MGSTVLCVNALSFGNTLISTIPSGGTTPHDLIAETRSCLDETASASSCSEQIDSTVIAFGMPGLSVFRLKMIFAGRILKNLLSKK